MALRNKSGRLRIRRKTEDSSPMEGLGNMADAMLVFACGLLLALIMSWNVDVTDQGEITNIDKKYEVEGVEDGTSEEISEENNLQEMGKVYKDPETGKYYVVEE